jgi:hypothetical protein
MRQPTAILRSIPRECPFHLKRNQDWRRLERLEKCRRDNLVKCPTFPISVVHAVPAF